VTLINHARLRRNSVPPTIRGCGVLLWAACFAWFATPAPALSNGQAAEVTLDGDWFFALDPLRRGEEHGWNLPPADWSGNGTLVLKNWDRVVTPHDYLTDPRYEWTGVAWYRRLVSVPKLGDGEVCRLQLGRVSSKCEVWVNGERAGVHVGGYSPFEFDITQHAKADAFNHVAVRVDNSWEIGDIPGPRLGDDPTHQMYVWRNYGGILRSASLVVSPAVYVANQKVETEAPSTSGDVTVTTKVFLRNGSKSSRSATVKVAVREAGENGSLLAEATPVKVTIPPQGEATARVTAKLPASAVRLWSVDSPQLYACCATVRQDKDGSQHEHVADFGVRTVEVGDGTLRLNGAPVRLAGANRVEGHPRFGGLEPPELVDADLRLMKEAHFELQRLQHYPLSEDILDWADRNGMLVIPEAPCWGLTAAELRDERYRQNFRRQLVELLETSWNHPCVVGWSVGNEYHAWTPEGADWTKTFVELVHRLDSTRPATYAALGYDASQPAASKEARGMHWVDFVSVNYYTSGEDAGRALDKIHAMWPEKPVLVSEYGKRTDQASEAARIRHFRDTLAAVRKRDFVMGMSYWSFNDYRSRYPGGDSTGHRPWGIVTADRTPRELYHVMKAELSPALLEIVQESPLRVRVEARADFPRMPLERPRLEVSDAKGAVVKSITLANISPGEGRDADCGSVAASKVRLISQTGFTLAELLVGEISQPPRASAD
jgi:beta-glucuronidase